MNKPSNFIKHTSSNKIQKALISNFYKSLLTIMDKVEVNSILDAGCGEGFTLSKLYLKNQYKLLKGIDSSLESVQISHEIYPNLDIIQADIYELPYKDNTFDLVLCNEVLEHLENPSKALEELIRVSKKYVLLSVPNEPFFMLTNLIRGKYIKSFGNHPEHINHWSKKSLLNLLSKHSSVLEVTTPYPWLLALIEKR